MGGLDDLEMRRDRCSGPVITAGCAFLGRDPGLFRHFAARVRVLGGRIAGDQSFEVDRGRGEQQLQMQFPGSAASGAAGAVAFEF